MDLSYMVSQLPHFNDFTEGKNQQLWTTLSLTSSWAINQQQFMQIKPIPISLPLKPLAKTALLKKQEIKAHQTCTQKLSKGLYLLHLLFICRYTCEQKIKTISVFFSFFGPFKWMQFRYPSSLFRRITFIRGLLNFPVKDDRH